MNEKHWREGGAAVRGARGGVRERGRGVHGCGLARSFTRFEFMPTGSMTLVSRVIVYAARQHEDYALGGTKLCLSERGSEEASRQHEVYVSLQDEVSPLPPRPAA